MGDHVQDAEGSVRVIKEVLFNRLCGYLKRNVVRNRAMESDFGRVMRDLIPNVKNGKVVKGSPVGFARSALLERKNQACEPHR